MNVIDSTKVQEQGAQSSPVPDPLIPDVPSFDPSLHGSLIGLPVGRVVRQAGSAPKGRTL
jgi:hypothetical protein